MIKVAIVEDEQPAVDRLKKMLSALSLQLEIVAIAMTGKTAIEQCELHKPELIFLDIHLPDMRGFEVIKGLSYDPYVIFTTAYAEYAIEAFRTKAVDYLLKPFDESQLQAAVAKYRSISKDQKPKVDWEEMSALFDKRRERTSLAVKNGDKIKLVDLDQIVIVEADDKYAKLTLQDGTTMFCDQLLKDIESKLNNDFLRIHRSIVINSTCIREISRGFKSRYTFHFKSARVGSVRSSASYSDEIKDRFNL